MEVSAGDEDGSLKSTAAIDAGLAKFAKKMPIFEPGERVESSSQEKPLMVNLDLALYKAKVLSRSYRFAEAEEILRKVWTFGALALVPYVNGVFLWSY